MILCSVSWTSCNEGVSLRLLLRLDAGLPAEVSAGCLHTPGGGHWIICFGLDKESVVLACKLSVFTQLLLASPFSFAFEAPVFSVYSFGGKTENLFCCMKPLKWPYLCQRKH